MNGLRTKLDGFDYGLGLLADGSYLFWLPRRIVLARWSLRGKYWPPYRKRLAPLRSLYWVLVRGHETEFCGRCGGPVTVVYWAPDDIWTLATGLTRSAGGEAAGGILCPPCLTDLVRPQIDGYLAWTCEVEG